MCAAARLGVRLLCAQALLLLVRKLSLLCERDGVRSSEAAAGTQGGTGKNPCCGAAHTPAFGPARCLRCGFARSFVMASMVTALMRAVSEPDEASPPLRKLQLRKRSQSLKRQAKVPLGPLSLQNTQRVAGKRQMSRRKKTPGGPAGLLRRHSRASAARPLGAEWSRSRRSGKGTPRGRTAALRTRAGGNALPRSRRPTRVR